VQENQNLKKKCYGAGVLNDKERFESREKYMIDDTMNRR
jgi:hypothetical protein